MSAFAGIVLSARMYSGQPSVGDGHELNAIAACVLGGVSMSGGVGTIGGTVLGVMVIGIINNGLNLLNVSSYWQLVAKGIIILAAVLIDWFKHSDVFKRNLNIIKRRMNMNIFRRNHEGLVSGDAIPLYHNGVFHIFYLTSPPQYC
ncbi:MAG: hypothetical protein V8S42_09320 [Lachnospiraceae bacterium]